MRELALLVHDDGENAEHVPSVVRDVIEGRIRRLPEATQAVLEAAAVIGTELSPDVVAQTLGTATLAVEAAAREAVDAGVLSSIAGRLRFSHDLLRETILERLDVPRRVALHHAISLSLEDRVARGAAVAPAEVARHCIAAVSVDGPDRAVHWALEAAAVDRAALAFREAAAHLRRLRAAVADGAAEMTDDQLFEVLIAEADVLARAGSTLDARGLLRAARDVAERAANADHTARVALATARLGARFASRRDDIVAELERALAVVKGGDPRREAQLTAALARELSTRWGRTAHGPVR